MNVEEYGKALANYTQSEEFYALPEDQKQKTIADIRSDYINKNPEANVEEVDAITEDRNINYLRNTGQGRIIPTDFIKENNIIFPTQEDGYKDLTQKEKQEKIAEFQAKIPEIAAMNPTQREDTEFYLNQSVREMNRRADGEKKGRISSAISGIGEGVVAGLAEGVGATEVAEEARAYFNENPEYDDEFTQQLAGGFGSAISSVAIIAGLALTTKGLGGSASLANIVGTSGSLASNGVMRFNEAYKNAIDAGLDEEKAVDAGFAATPASVIDVMGDKILASKLLPNEVSKVFSVGTQAEKRLMLGQLIKETSTRGKLVDYATAALGEGASEAVGDYAAAYGPYMVTGDDENLPTGSESARSFLIGAILGGGINAALEAPDLGNAKNKALAKVDETIDELQGEKQQAVYDLVASGRYKDALALSKRNMESEVEPTPVAAPLAESPAQVENNVTEGESLTFGPENPVAEYTDLTQTIFDSSRVYRDEVTVGEFNSAEGEANTRLAVSAPARLNTFAEIDTLATSNDFDPQQTQSVKTLIDTAAARWMATNPSAKLNDFYSKLNFKTPESLNQAKAVVDAVTQPAANATEAFGSLLGNMIGMMRSTGIIEDIVTPEELNTLKTELGVEGDFTPESDTQLGARFQAWLASPTTDQPIFDKLKGWVSDLYQNLRNVFSGKASPLDPIFENLFQVKFTPREMMSRVAPVQAVVQPAAPKSASLQEATKIAEEDFAELQKMMGPLPENNVIELDENEQTQEEAQEEPINEVIPENASVETPAKKVAKKRTSSKKSGNGIKTLQRLAKKFPEKADFYNRLASDIKQKNPTVQIYFSSEPDTQYGSGAAFYRKENVIIIYPTTSQAEMDRLLAHEISHALTYADLNTFINTRGESDYRQKMSAALVDESTPEYIKTLIQAFKRSAESQRIYGAIVGSDSQMGFEELAFMSPEEYAHINLDEFLAAAMSSQEFQNKLSKIPFNGSTVWKTIVDAITGAFSWIASTGSPELVMRSNGENVLNATLTAARQIVDSPVTSTESVENNINFSPRLKEIDNQYRELFVRGATDEQLQSLIDEAAVLNGFSTTVYYRGDEVEWSQADRPIYLSTDKVVADVFGEDGIVRKFYIKDGLNLAPVGSKINNAIVETSSYLGPTGQITADGRFEPRINTAAVANAGFDGLTGTLDGDTAPEIVILNPSFVKLADAVTFDMESMPILPSHRFNTAKNNINFSPQQTRSKQLSRSFKRMNEIKKSAITDKYDSRTQEMIKIMGGINATDVMNLPDHIQNYFFILTDNIYEARKSAINDPSIRMDSDHVIQQLSMMKKVIDSQSIQRMMEDYEGIVDFDELGVNYTDPKSFKKAINDYMEANDLEDLAAKQQKSSRSKARRQKLYDNWRNKFAQARKNILERYADSENYISEIEAAMGEPIHVESLREFLKFHFDYLTSMADISQLESKKLFNHFFAINNLHDGNFIGLQVTVERIAQMRDQNENIQQLSETFRDPVWAKNKIIQTLSTYNQFAELHQVQIQRLTAFNKSKDWLQNQFLGRLYDEVIRTSNNRKLAYIEEYIAFRNDIEEQIGRELDTEDRVVTAIFGRLVQFGLGDNPDTQLLKNIKKERRSIDNIILNSPSPENRTLFRERVKDVFEKSINGLESYGDGAMIHLMETLSDRMRGNDTAQVGLARRALLEKEQEIFARFNTESKIISEGFHNIPFDQQFNFISNDVASFNPKDDTPPIDAPMEESSTERRPGMTPVASHFKARKGNLGEGQYYSYNNEHILVRNVERIAIDNATIAERKIIAQRLKPGQPLNNIISLDSEGHKHPQRVQFLEKMVSNLYNNAMSKGMPTDYGVDLLRSFTSIYARPVLSSIHHFITQPTAACVDYAVRTGNIAGWFQAAKFYAGNSDMIDAWFIKNQRWTGDRMALEAQAIDQRRSPQNDSDEKFINSRPVKGIQKFYEKAGEIMTFSMRKGDNYSTKITVLAEYARLLKEKGYVFDNVTDVDFGTVEGRILTEATLNSEKNINTSNKILRGELFTDRRLSTTIIRNLLFAFSAHSASLATQMNMAVRDLAELRSLGATDGEIEAKVRTISAILAQQLAFTSARFLIGGLTAKLIIELVSDLYDDEEGKIAALQEKVWMEQKKGDPVKVAYAEEELKNAKSVRRIINKFKVSTQSGDSWFKQILRDGTGSFHLAFNNGAMQKMVYFIEDGWFSMMQREGEKEVIEDYKSRIKASREKGRLKEAARLTEQMVTLQSSEYIPLSFQNMDSSGIAGIYGAAIDNNYRAIKELNSAAMGSQEYNLNDFFLLTSSLGIGQSELNKSFRLIDQLEDEQWKSHKTFEEERLPAARERKAGKR